MFILVRNLSNVENAENLSINALTVNDTKNVIEFVRKTSHMLTVENLRSLIMNSNPWHRMIIWDSVAANENCDRQIEAVEVRMVTVFLKIENYDPYLDTLTISEPIFLNWRVAAIQDWRDHQAFSIVYTYNTLDPLPPLSWPLPSPLLTPSPVNKCQTLTNPLPLICWCN